MRWITILPGLTAISVFGVAAVSTLHDDEPTRVPVTPPPVSADAVVQSFERELKHTPGPTAGIRRESIDDDQLYRAINTIHWTPDMQANSESTDYYQEKD
jgi:hypothetical protein